MKKINVFLTFLNDNRISSPFSNDGSYEKRNAVVSVFNVVSRPLRKRTPAVETVSQSDTVTFFVKERTLRRKLQPKVQAFIWATKVPNGNVEHPNLTSPKSQSILLALSFTGSVLYLSLRLRRRTARRNVQLNRVNH
jgi:hypothetical protein